MKKIIRRFACCSFLTIASIGISFNTEARVTKEVAEAVLPFLMEAVGIPLDGSDADTNMKIQAILNMIYTDEGQQQMVRWARNGEFPSILTGAGFTTESPYRVNQTNLQKLFPCGPGTFSSYATHSERLGYIIHRSKCIIYIHEICRALIRGVSLERNKDVNKANAIIELFPVKGRTTDIKLAIVLFVLDICDTADQIKVILNQVLDNSQVQIRNTEIDSRVNSTTYNEYDHRPVSATSIANAQRQVTGDCVETLYRHLINIAIQNNGKNPRNFYVEHLPIALKCGYYGKVHVSGYDVEKPNPAEQVPSVLLIPANCGEAGMMNPMHHDHWNRALAGIESIDNISNGNLDDIIMVFSTLQNNLQSKISSLTRRGKEDIAQNIELSPQMTLHEQHNIIENSLNAIDGRGNFSDGRARFLVGYIEHIRENTGDPKQLTPGPNYENATKYLTNFGLTNLEWISTLIEVVDRLWGRRIIIGCGPRHAEIIAICK